MPIFKPGDVIQRKFAAYPRYWLVLSNGDPFQFGETYEFLVEYSTFCFQHGVITTFFDNEKEFFELVNLSNISSLYRVFNTSIIEIPNE